MRLRKHPRKQHVAAYATLSMLAFAAAAPAVVGSREMMPVFNLTQLAAARDTYTLTGPLPLLPHAGLMLERGTLSLTAAQAPAGRSSESLLKLLTGGKARLVLSNATLSFTSAAVAYTTPTTQDAVMPIIASLLGSRFEQLVLRHANIDIPQADGTAFHLADVNADVSLRRKGFVSAKGSFMLRGRKLQFDALIGLGDRKSATRLPITASLDGELLQANLNGRISLGEGIQLSSQKATIALPSVRALAKWLGYDWPTRKGFEKFAIEGNLDWVNQSVSMQQAQVALDDNEATGNVYVVLDRAKPTVDATLALRRFDIAPYVPALGEEGAPAGQVTGQSGQQAGQTAGQQAGSPSFAMAARLLQVPIIGHLDADLRVSADRVVMGSTVLGRGAATITAKSGRLTANLAEFVLDSGGTANMQLGVDMTAADEPRFQLSARMNRVQLAQFLPALGNVPLVQAYGNIAADVEGRGKTGPRLEQTLAGRASASFNEGGQLGFDLVPLIAMGAGAQSPGNRAPVPAAGTGTVTALRGSMAIDQMTARFTIASGLWTAESLWASTGNAIYNVTGSIYPPGQVMDVKLSRGSALSGLSSPLHPAPVSGAASAAEVLVRGSWTNPVVLPAASSRKAEGGTKTGADQR